MGGCSSDNPPAPDFGTTSAASSARPASLEEWFSPELHRKKELALDRSLDFDYQDCEFVDANAIEAQLRPTFSRLEAFGDRLNPTIPTHTISTPGDPFHFGTFETCDPEDCYLRLSTANLEDEVTIRADGLIEFETLDGTETVDFRIREQADHRGAIVFARKIKIEGTLKLGWTNLILVAREGIDMSSGSIVAYGPKSPQQTVQIATNFDENPFGFRCVVPSFYHSNDPDDCFFPVESISNETSNSFPRDGAPSGSVIMVTQVADLGLVNLKGQGGDHGEILTGDVHCSFKHVNRDREAGRNDPNPTSTFGLNLVCTQAASKLRSGKPGGDGGNSGHLYVYAQDINGLDFQGAAGAGGLGGKRDYTVFHLNRIGIPRHPKMADGADGEVGRYGFIEIDDQKYYDLALILGLRAAQRLWHNGRYFARQLHYSVAGGPDNAEIAKAALGSLMDNFCAPTIYQRDSDGYATSGSEFLNPVRSFDYTTSGSLFSAAPYGYTAVDHSAVDQRPVLCDSAAIRQEFAETDLNWFGFEEDYLMYLHPDVVEEFREDALTSLKDARDLFQEVRTETTADLRAIETLERGTLAMMQNEADRFELRAQEQAALVERTLNLLEATIAEADGLTTAFEAQVEVIRANLATSPCDANCVLGNVLNFTAKIISAVQNLANAFSAIANLVKAFDDGLFTFESFHEQTGKKTDKPDELKLKEIFAYASYIYKGFNVKNKDGEKELTDSKLKKVTGLKAVIEKTKKAYDAAKKVKAGPPKPKPDVSDKWTAFIVANEDAKAAIRETMRKVQASIVKVEGLPSGRVKDRAGALGDLRYLVGLLEERLQLLYRIDELRLEHLNASGSLLVLMREHELILAMKAELDFYITESKCRIGTLTGSQCDGIAVQGATKAELLQQVCLVTQPLSDRVLLFDFYYDRSKAFTTLDERESSSASADNFSRYLLDGDILGTFEDDLERGWLNTLLVAPNTGSLRMAICADGQTCANGLPADSPYRDDVVSRLRNYGVTTFSIDDDCTIASELAAQTGTSAIPAPADSCPPSVFTSGGGEPRRVTDVDVRLLMDPSYRLGCLGSSCTANGGYEFRAYLGHEAAGTFFTPSANGLQTRYVGFPEGNTRRACEIANQFDNEPTPRDCGQVINFSRYKTASQADDWAPQNFGIRSKTFGTSVRGQWRVDIGPTLNQLNGNTPNADQCYADKAVNGTLSTVPTRCLPESCLSACFDDVGVRLTANAPEYCECYDTNNQKLATIPATLADICANRPAVLQWNEGAANGLEECSGNTVGYGENGSKTLYETSCDRFVEATSGSFLPNGDSFCCSPDGRFKLNLSETDQGICEARGYLGNESCRAPDVCREVCGPRCKQFKRAIRGFEIDIDWMVRSGS